MGKATNPRKASGKSAPKAPVRTGQNKAQLSRLASAAFNEGESMGASVAAIAAAFTAPILALARRCTKGQATPEAFNLQYSSSRRSYMAGYMAARIPSNRTTDERISSAMLALDKSAPDAKEANKHGRRTETEQTAYNNAKQAWSARIKAANVPVPATAGGGKRGKGKGKTTAKKVEPSIVTLKRQASAALKFAPPASVDREAALNYLQRQAATMQAYVDKAQAKSGGALPPVAVSAVQDFLAAIKRAS